MENQTEEVVITVSAELEAVVSSSSSIELTKAQAHALSFAPAMNQVHELSKALSTMDKENPSETDAKVARINRLAMVKNRTATAKIKDELKASLLTETKLIDSLHNVVKHTSELTEAEYEKIEKFAENREKERKAKLYADRFELLSTVCDNPSIYPLGEMDEAGFTQLYDSMVLLNQSKIDAAKKAQEEKEEAERVEKLRVARTFLIQEFHQFLTVEQLSDLGKISDGEFSELESSVKILKQEHDEAIEAQRLENEKLKEQAAIKEARTSELMPFAVYIRDFNALLALDEEEYQLQFADIKKGAEDDLKFKKEKELQIQERTDEAFSFLLNNGFRESKGGVTSIEYFHFIGEHNYNNFQSNEELLQFKEKIQSENIRDKKEKDQEIENARLAKELQEKKDKEAQDEADKIAAEKAKAKAAKDLMKAGDKARLTVWIDSISAPEIDTKGMTEESVLKVKDIQDKIESMKAWAKKELEKI